MTKQTQKTNDAVTETTDPKKSTFLTDDSFELLKEAQKRIQDTTGFSPSLKILINDVVNNDSVNQSIDRLTNKLISA